MIAFKQKISNMTTDLVNIYDDYNANTTYSSGDKVSYGGFYWQMIPSTATGITPSDNSLYWEKIGVANRESIIDLRSTTKSEKDDSFYIEFPIDYTYTYLAIGYYATMNLKVEALDENDNIVKVYIDETQSINEDVFDYYDYMYSDYSLDTNRTRFIPLVHIGKKIKITFTGDDKNVPTPNCGFVLAGDGINLGTTLSNVNFKLNSYSVKKTDSFGVMTIDKRAVQNIIDFETIIDRGEFMEKRNKIKSLYDEFCCFILNESDIKSEMIGVGVIENVTQLYDENSKSTIGYSIVEAI